MLKQLARFLLIPLWLWCVAPFAHAGSYEDFFSAIARDDGDRVAALVARGFDPNSRSPEGQAGVFFALQNDAYVAAEALMRAKDLNVNVLNATGESPLMMAALKGRLDWTQKLLARGAEVNKAGWTPLHYAATGPEPQVVRLLLEKGALIDAESPNGTTPLMMAARYGSELNVKALAARQADGRKKNQQGLDAAAFARLAGREALAVAIEARYR